jgi:hypothetical protein
MPTAGFEHAFPVAARPLQSAIFQYGKMNLLKVSSFLILQHFVKHSNSNNKGNEVAFKNASHLL